MSPQVDPVQVYGVKRLRREYFERNPQGDFKAFLERFDALRQAVRGHHKPVRFYGLTFGHPAAHARAHGAEGAGAAHPARSAQAVSVPQDPGGQLDLLKRAGLADPSALTLAVAASRAYEQLGSPEGELALAQCAVHLACAPKSNAVYRAFGEAWRAAQESGSLMPPLHIRNAPTRLMRQLGYGEGYAYDHDAPDRFSGQNYFPDGMARAAFYEPTAEGEEAALRRRLQALAKLRRGRDPAK